MVRWLRRSCVVVLLLLAALALFGWVRSLAVSDTISLSRWWPTDHRYEGTVYQLTSGRGVVGLMIYRLHAYPGAEGAREDSDWRYARHDAADFELPTNPRWRRFRFGAMNAGPDPVSGISGATVSLTARWVPHWLVASLCLCPVATWFAISRPLRARRRRTR